MSYRFNGFCVTCPSKELCFDKGICMRRNITNEFDDDDNISDISGTSDDETELTNESTYSFYAGDIDSDKGK